jgi:phage tail-like protein
MKMSARYLYLNQGGLWPKFDRERLESSADGALTPSSLPALLGAAPIGLATRPSPADPSGLTVGPGSDIYWIDSASARIKKLDGCDRTITELDCLGGSGSGPTQFLHPRGLLYHPAISRLLVADSGNARVTLIDLVSGQLTGFWGGDGELFKDPGGLARDSAGSTYVADLGLGVVKKIGPRGVEVIGFSDAHHNKGWKPTELAVGRGPWDGEHVFVIDRAAGLVQVLTTEGAVLPVIRLSGNAQPIGLAADNGGVLYVGDEVRNTIQKYRIGPNGRVELEGDAHYRGPISALALDGAGGLLVLPDDSGPLRLALDGGHVPLGRLMGGPFFDPTLAMESWHRLRSEGPALPAGSTVTLYIRLELHGAPKPPPPWPAVNGNAPSYVDLPGAQTASPPSPLARGTWYRVAGGARECLFPGTPGADLWVAAELSGDGDSAPTLTQLRLDFQYEALAHRLPDCYFDDVPGRGFAIRLVGLFAGLYEDSSSAIDRLPARFDPDASPAEDLPNLAGLVGLKHRPDMPEDRLRNAIALAASQVARRGTSRGLADALKRDLGVCAVIDEPIRQAVAWILPGDCGPGDASDGSRGVGSVLGLTTALAAAEPEGAVIGNSLTLDQSQLIADSEIGLPLFGDLAHRVTVRVRRPPGAGADWLRAVREVVDRELPCHVEAQICPVEPLMKLGVQARLGVDAVLGGPVAPEPLDSVAPGAAPVLAGLLSARLGASALGAAPLGPGFPSPRVPSSPESLP